MTNFIFFYLCFPPWSPPYLPSQPMLSSFSFSFSFSFFFWVLHPRVVSCRVVSCLVPPRRHDCLLLILCPCRFPCLALSFPFSRDGMQMLSETVAAVGFEQTVKEVVPLLAPLAEVGTDRSQICTCWVVSHTRNM